ncbi:UNVERIFIED_CONTAM: hypothetical protein Sangu_1707900 [Sesamum angustifolium]|uniref:Uncharacterized protein n=1 Tax=Sesamum angustifolium TaxID=2727405 RepID=A0AAW2MJ86_9LAMI
MSAIKRVLRVFGQASGQEVNFEKSSIVISRNISEVERQWLADIIGVTLVMRHEKYLGLSAVVVRSRK